MFWVGACDVSAYDLLTRRFHLDIFSVGLLRRRIVRPTDKLPGNASEMVWDAFSDEVLEWGNLFYQVRFRTNLEGKVYRLELQAI